MKLKQRTSCAAILAVLAHWAIVPVKAASSPDSLLADAAQRRDAAALQSLLRAHANVNNSQADGATALAWAAHWDDLTIAALLIRAGADPNLANDLGITPLALACSNGSLAMTEKLLQAGANPNAARPDGETVLMTAAETGNAEIVKALITKGAKVDAQTTSQKQTALMWAAAESHPEAVQALIDAHASVDARSSGGFTALLFAARAGDLGSVKRLVAAGADLNAASSEGVTPLIAASAGMVAIAANEYHLSVSPSGHQDVALLLLEKGADPNRKDKFGQTALHGAAETGRPKLVEALLAHKANPNAEISVELPPQRGDYVTRAAFVHATPFWIAARNADAAVMSALAKGGADPNIPSQEGTPLLAAVGLGQLEQRLPPESQALEAVRVALSAGAHVNAANQAGLTALHVAASLGRDSIIQALADSGADLEARDAQHRTALNVAENPRRPWPTSAALLRKLAAAKSGNQ